MDKKVPEKTPLKAGSLRSRGRALTAAPRSPSGGSPAGPASADGIPASDGFYYWQRKTEMSSQQTSRRKHPHFDDRGTLDWFPSFAEALAAAKRDGKRLFIEIGREL
jgi:hypothetical protein